MYRAKAEDAPIVSHAHHLGTDSLTTDSTLFCWQTDRQTQRQVDRHADSIWCKTGDLWTYAVARKTLIPLFVCVSLSLPFSLSPPPWHMLCVVGCTPHADPMPSALLGLRATCATLSQQPPSSPYIHTQTHQTLALSLHLCPWERISDRKNTDITLSSL